MAALHITTNDFKKEVLESEKPVLVDFWATWCRPCQILLPVIEELADEMKDAKICKVNVDEEPELAAQFGIMSIPTLLVFRNGQLVDKAVGVRSKYDIMKMIEG